MMQAFKNDIQKHGVSLSAASAQMDEFDDVLDTVLALPGDWHTGMNFGQSILKVFYKTLLEIRTNSEYAGMEGHQR